MQGGSLELRDLSTSWWYQVARSDEGGWGYSNPEDRPLAGSVHVGGVGLGGHDERDNGPRVCMHGIAQTLRPSSAGCGPAHRVPATGGGGGISDMG
jgi:hypothetical protein